VKSLVRAGVVVVAAAYVLGVLPAAAQPPAPPTPTTPPPGTPTPSAESPTGVTEGPTPSGILPSVQIPGVLLPPRNVLDFLYAPPAQGPLTLTPSLAITEEFNDNVFLTHSNKRSDFITQFTPGLTLQAQQPGFQLLSSFNFTAEIYAKETELDNAANRIYFLTSVSYQATPSVTLSLTENLAFSRDNSNTATISGVSSGRGETWSNVLAPAVSVQLTPRTTWRVSGAYTLERFSSNSGSNSGSNNRGSNNGSNNGDSNIYRVGTGLDHTLTPRLTLTAAYDFGYLDVQQEPTAFNHTLRFGGSYRLTPTLTVSGTAGPSWLVTDRDTNITPSVSARINKQMSWGFMSAFYDRAIGTSGGFGGLSDNQTFGGNITVSTLLRGLYLDLSPRYSMSKTTGASQSNSDINTLTVTLSARYQIARYITLVGGYSYLHQTGSGNGNTGGTSGTSGTSNDVDVDQNRVTFGIQFGYPINFY
jgi:hypothetical protein